MRRNVFAGCLSLSLLVGCGEPPSDMTDPGGDDEFFYDGDEKADGVDPPKPAAGTKTRRGPAAEYDAGPPAGSRWAELFAQVPNYRQIGIRVLGGRAFSDEKFRWEFGPMFYRGRLTPKSVKVFVVGQEGAQDESLSNRAFTGSTGTKMQNFLRALGIDRSYLFLNTFTYTIHGQYTEMDGTVTPQIRWLAQSPQSPVVKHRHSMFDYMLEQNQGTVQLVIGVGVAGRDSVVTWVQSLWDKKVPGSGATKCKSITSCDGSVVGPGVQILGLPHPGAANPRYGGDDAYTSLSSQFKRAVARVATWAKNQPGWLPMDPGITSRFGTYIYTNYPIPHRDFAFGSMDVVGDWGTTSNRRDGGQAIQVYSSEGCYNNAARDANGKCYGDPMDPNYKTLPLDYVYPADVTRTIPELPSGDVAWESPRQGAATFDAGPPAELAPLLAGEASGYPMPDFSKLGVTQHPSLDSTWLYRGRLDDAKTLVIADQDSQDDMFSCRAYSGVGGQRLQTFLGLLGANRSYAVLRSLPVDVLDLTPAQALAAATDPATLKLLKQIVTTVVQRSGTQRILTVGPMAKEQLARMGVTAAQVINLDAADDKLNHVTGWQSALRTLGASSPTSYKGQITTIPRGDLPVHTRWWVGANGSRGSRALNQQSMILDGNYYKVSMPRWIAALPPQPLSADEEAAVKLAPPLQ